MSAPKGEDPWPENTPPGEEVDHITKEFAPAIRGVLSRAWMRGWSDYQDSMNDGDWLPDSLRDVTNPYSTPERSHTAEHEHMATVEHLHRCPICGHRFHADAPGSTAPSPSQGRAT